MSTGIELNDDFSYTPSTEQALRNMHQTEYSAVKALGDDIGYGRLMQLAQECWRENIVKEGHGFGGEFVYGPCVAMTVKCDCNAGCDWCGGSQRLTHKVKQIKDSMKE